MRACELFERVKRFVDLLCAPKYAHVIVSEMIANLGVYNV